MRVEQAEYRRADPRFTVGTGAKATVAAVDTEAPARPSGATRLLQGPSTFAQLAQVLETPRDAAPWDKLWYFNASAVGSVLITVAETYERPVRVPELIVAGLRHIARDEPAIAVAEDGPDIVVRDGERELARIPLPDLAALAAQEREEDRTSDDGCPPMYYQAAAVGNAVRRGLEALREARPRLATHTSMTRAFLDFLPSYLDPYTHHTMAAGGGAGNPRYGFAYGAIDGAATLLNVLRGSPAAHAGLETGDHLVRVADEDVRGWPLSRVRDLFAQQQSGGLSLVVERAGAERPVIMERAVFADEPVVSGYVYRGAAVIRINSFVEGTAKAVEKTLADLRASNPSLIGVVLDLRNNTGGHLDEGIAVADLFLDHGRIISVRYPRVPKEDKHHEAEPGDIARGLRMAVLINGGTASSSEVVALALGENDRARLTGTPSYGKDAIQGVQRYQPVQATIGRYVGPRGTSPRDTGVRPQTCTTVIVDGACIRTARAPQSDLDVAVDQLMFGGAGGSR